MAKSGQNKRPPERPKGVLNEVNVRVKRSEGKGWKNIPIGGIIAKGGTAKEYKTGDWRTFKPVVDISKCINCLQCWICCPDSSVILKDAKMEGFDYDHCKGCAICASICPVKCIEMEKE